jgi:hypothetical protein
MEYNKRLADSKNECPYARMLEPFLTYSGAGFGSGSFRSNKYGGSTQGGFQQSIRMAQHIRALPPGYEKVGGVDLTYFLCPVVGSGRFSSAEMVSSVSCHAVRFERVIPILVGEKRNPCSASFLIGSYSIMDS